MLLDETENHSQTALSENLNKEIKRVEIFLSRSMPAPIDIYIRRLGSAALDYDGSATAYMLELILKNFHRCRHFSIQDGSPLATEKVIEKICGGPSPLLSSIDFGVSEYEEDFILTLPCDAPRLKIAQLDRIEVYPNPHFYSIFQQLVSLRLINISLDEENHAPFADALMSMRTLDHLELTSFHEWPSHLPALAQPTIRFLHLHILVPENHDAVIESFRAVSVTTLSIDCSYRRCDMDFTLEEPPQVAFPSLKHLILVNIEMNPLKLDAVAHRFPEIERLTCQGFGPDFGIGRVLAAMGPQPIEGNPALAADVSLHWPKLHTIAVSGSAIARNIPDPKLNSQVSALQETGIPIRKLMLPPALVAHASGDLMASLRKLVEVEDFRLDWPRPFEHFDEFRGASVNFYLCQVNCQ